MKKRLVIYLFMILLFVNIVYAMPPHPDLENKMNSGAVENIYSQKFYQDALKNGLDQPSSFNLKNFINKYKSEKGTSTVPFKVLVVLVDFPDKAAQVSPNFFDNLVFSDNKPSLKHFYLENSYGQLDLVYVPVNLPSALGWQRAPQTYAYYVNNPNAGMGFYPRNTQKLTEDLVDLVDPLVNFADYDNNGDGYVDGILIAHAGRGAEFSGSYNDIWSHKWDICSNRIGCVPPIVDGVRVSDYSVQPEYWINLGDMTIGVYAHESGHLFGLPDLYDVDGSSRGIGRWSLMSGGSWNGALGNSPAHFDAWSKQKLGFLTPQTISSSPSTVNLPSVEDNPIIYKLWKDNNFWNEYFLIENRQKILYDSGLPGDGLLIWHIDENKKGNNQEWWICKPNDQHYLVALEQADGLWGLERNFDSGDTADSFPGTSNKRSFTSLTTPDSKPYLQQNSNSYVKIEEISNSGPTMTAKLSVHTEVPGDTTPPTSSVTSPVPGETFTGNVISSASANDNGGLSKVQFCFGNYFMGEDFSSPYSTTWNSKSIIPGTYVLYARATDLSGNSANSQSLNINTKYCGDLDKNNIYNILDVAALVDYVFRGGAAPSPLAIGDTNGDGIASDALDVTALVDYVLRGWFPPASCNTVTSVSGASQEANKIASKTSTVNKKTTSKRGISAKVIDGVYRMNDVEKIYLILVFVTALSLLIAILIDNKKSKKQNKKKK